ncbi:ferritin-like domain-containing protein [Granulosicoccus sp. 3-233]|uniref:ferritin-like domain-containing protein n=1 Tax=Granulosicoccus sp. 3-233 TaxID=3417969 RepID=UPI003D355AA2
MKVPDIFLEAETVLRMADPVDKANASIALYRLWLSLPETVQEQSLVQPSVSVVQVIDAPGRPERPALVEAHQLPRRGLGSVAGRVALVHSLAHIEFNAINLALDAVYRFREMPSAYVTDWLRVASDEGEHFLLLHHRLSTLDSHYGALSAHDGLWDMARRTDHDVLVRMALVPRILEARGLDVAPPMIAKLQHLKDEATADILQRIYTDEITHVEVGNRWFRFVCEQQGLDGTDVFRDLLRGENSAYLRSPYNREARLQAGFNEQELALIREMELEYQAARQA